MILYSNPYSQHARRVVALLEEVGLAHELRHVALEKGEHLTPAYLAINPNHQVPTLIDGEVTIHESNAILRYLCVKHELEDWYPGAPAARAAVEQWLDWGTSRLTPAVIDIVLNKVFLGDKGDPAAIARGESKLKELAPILAAGLDGKDFLCGARPTIADLAVGSSIAQLAFAGAVPDEPAIGAWQQRLAAIGGVRAEIPA
jgi:glutathione S-transferase